MSQNDNFMPAPPSDIDAERAVLGSMMRSYDAVADVIEILRREDFYLSEHQEIYNTMTEMFKKSVPIDLMTTYSELKSRKSSEMVGGMTYLSKLMDSAIVYSNAKYYANTVANLSKMRKLLVEADSIKSAVYSMELTPEEILDNSEQRIMEIAHLSQRKNYVDIADVFTKNIKHIQELALNKGEIPGLPTGFKKIDEILGGLQKTDLIILAARPGVGKTAFALNIAKNAALDGAKVMVFDLEMSDVQLGQRVLSMTSNVSMEKLKLGTVEPEDWDSLSDTHDLFDNVDFVIDDTSSITPIEIKNKCRRFKAERGGLDLVIVDYLQLMGSSTDNRVNEIAQITRSFKIMAKELDCPIILLSQLSRNAVDRNKKASAKPKKADMADLRDSGAIEQDADIIIFLRREDSFQTQDEPADTNSDLSNVCYVDIAKHRNGSTGTIALAWIPRYVKFGNIADENYSYE